MNDKLPSDPAWDAYRALSMEERTRFGLRVLQDQLSHQGYLLYGWPVQKLYEKYLDTYLPGRENLRILELGPGDHWMTSALWMLNARVKHLTLLDRFEGIFLRNARYHQPLAELLATILLHQRPGFNNFYPFSEATWDRFRAAIIVENGTIRTNPDHLTFVRHDDFSAFPFGDGEFDYLYSHATLEHFTSIPESVREMHRVLRPGGVMVHQIDIRDHRDFQDPFRYLEMPSAEWKFGQLKYPVNQWRAFQFRAAFEQGGFSVETICKVRRNTDLLRHVALAPEFAAMPVDEVAITGATFVLRKR